MCLFVDFFFNLKIEDKNNNVDDNYKGIPQGPALYDCYAEARDCMVPRYYGPNTVSSERRPPSDNSDMSSVNLSYSTAAHMLSNTPPAAQLSRPRRHSQS